MKTLLIIWISVCMCSYSAVGQTKRDKLKMRQDSLRLKADLEAIRSGRNVDTNRKKSIVQVRTSARATVDTAALKSGLIRPTPSSPNNPNPHEPVPNAVNAEPPATSQPHLPTPVVPVNQRSEVGNRNE